MKEIFDFKRFWKFFLYDLRNSKNYFWLSLLLCAFMPAISFVFAQTFSRIFFGTWISDGQFIQIISVIFAVLVVIFTYPVKAYGRITDKRAGSSWVMIPASSVEKTLSIIVVSCVVLPVVFFAIMTGADALLGLLFRNVWPEALICKIFRGGSFLAAESEGLLHVNIPCSIWYCWFSNVLTFILGSIFFKKAKIGKTFLVLFILGQAISIVFSVFFFGTPAFADLIQGNVESFSDSVWVVDMLKNMNWMFAIYFWGYAILIIGLLWARIKTIKH